MPQGTIGGPPLLPEQEPTRWRIRDVQPRRSYVVETELDGATLSFEWRFDPVSERRTRLTQRIVLSGDDAAQHVEGVKVGFGPNLSAGMKRIAEALAAAQAADSSVG